MTFLAWEYGNQQHGALPSLPAWTENAKKAWESVNKLGTSKQCRRREEKGVHGGVVQGDRSVNHQWLCFILPPLSKTFKGGFVYLLRRQELGIWGTGNQDPTTTTPFLPPLLFPTPQHSPSSVHPSALQHTPHIHPLLCPLFCTSSLNGCVMHTHTPWQADVIRGGWSHKASPLSKNSLTLLFCRSSDLTFYFGLCGAQP